MIDYESFRQFADSWGLLYLTVVFVIVVLFVFRPGSKKTYDELSRLPLKDDDHVQ